MAQFQLTCFGDLQVALSGKVIASFPTDKTLAVLIYLALEGRLHERKTLAQFFWPGYSEASARNNLRQALYQLRQLLPDVENHPPWLLLTRQSVQFNPDAALDVDVATFTALLAQSAGHTHTQLRSCPVCLARLRQAVDIYRSDFLSGFSVVDSNPFEEWRRITQEQLHVQMIDALSQLASAAESAGDEAGALQAARRQVDLEPWLESAHRQIMRLLARRGQSAAAVVQYKHCCRILAEELRTKPDQETVALYEQIQRGDLSKVSVHQGAKVSQAIPPPATPPPPHPLPPSSVPAHNLPPTVTPLVGRSRSLAEVSNRLRQLGGRLLTLVGPGGMGKTRLAVEVGRQQLTAYADGVWYVPLASISAPDALVAAVATALGLTLSGGDPRKTLLQSLRQKQLLLILDNFEQLLVAGSDAVDLVVDLLEGAPELQILVTSRQRLNLRSEQVFVVPPLSYASNATLDEAETSAAVRLFVQAVQRVQADFQLTAANLAPVLRICQLVQGMPLGLELAAAHANELPLPALAEEIAQHAEFLRVDWRDLPERQRSMRAVFAWSWQLLTPAEQDALRQISIFRGGFDRAAAQMVTGATLPILTRLIHKSLLQRQETTPGEVRYLMHELLRQFAAEELNASGERAGVEARHGRYYLAYLAAQGVRLGRQEPKEASAEIQVELDNVRLAWQWAATQGGLAELDQAIYAWWQFCQFQGLETEGRQSFAVALEGVRRQVAITAADAEYALFGQRLLAKLLAIHADYLFAQGRDEEMAEQAREAIRLGAASGGVEGETFGTFVLGRALQELDQYQAAGDLWRQTLQLIRTYQSSHADSELLHDLNWMAYVWLRGDALHFGDDAGGRTYMVQALQLAQALGKRRCELHSLSGLARTDFYQGDFAAAESGFVAALALAHALGYRLVEMGAQGGLGELLRLRGDYTTARTLQEQAVATATDLALPYEESLALANLIRLYCQLGDQAAATQRYEQLVQLLAHVKLPKECQLAGWLAAALKAHYVGENQSALHYAEQANQLAEQGEILFRRVDTALIVGHMRAANAQWETAATAYQQALEAFQQFGNRALTAEPLAGLAQIALAQGDLVGAQTQVEAILSILATAPRAGYNTPFLIYLTGYRVLAANGDPRAAALLQQGYDLLQQDAAALDEESRQRFLTGVPIHGELIAAYVETRKPHASVIVPESHTAPSHNLPIFATPLVGRTQALAEMGDLLQQPNVRLLTLIGPGGIGKTRLAVEMGYKRLSTLANDVIFVSLAALNTPAALAGAIVTALGIALQNGDPRSTLLQSLRPRRLLLILDNFEHLLVASLEAVDLVIDLLHAAPGVQIIVTSRERLNLRDEQLYPVPTLTFSPSATLTEAAASSAVRLFVQLVQRVQADFQLTAANLAPVLHICQLVQGIPLGLELAAAHANELPLSALAEAIAQSAEFLTVNWRDLPERQRSMRAVFGWSWQLLTFEEQRTLRQISVFRGGFDSIAAQRVTNTTPRVLTSLNHKSLLYWHETASNEMHYAMHVLLRQFANEKLADQHEEDQAVRIRYCEYYLNFAAARERRLAHNEPWQAVRELQENIDNIRQAWEWAVADARIELISHSLYTLSLFFGFTGLLKEGEVIFRQASERLGALGGNPSRNTDLDLSVSMDAVLGRLAAIRSAFLFRLGQYEAAIDEANQAIAGGTRGQDASSLAYGYLTLGTISAQRSQYTQAQEMLSHALQAASSASAEQAVDEMLAEIEWNVHIWLRLIAKRLDNLNEAQIQNQLALDLCQRQGRLRGEAVCLLYLAGIAAEMGDLNQARTGYEQAFKLAVTLGYRWCVGVAKHELGQVMLLQGDFSQAADLMEQALETFREMGDRWQIMRTLASVIHLHCSTNHADRCATYILAAQETAQYVDSPEIQSFFMLALTRYRMLNLQYDEAFNLCQEALATESVSNRKNLTRTLLALGDRFKQQNCVERVRNVYGMVMMLYGVEDFDDTTLTTLRHALGDHATLFH